MALDYVLLIGFVAQAALIVAGAALALLWDPKQAATVIAGGIIGFAPLLLIGGPLVWIAWPILLALASLALIVVAYLRRRMLLAGFLSAVTVASALTPYSAGGNGPLDVVLLIRELALVATPLICVIAACSLTAFLADRRRAAGA